MSQKVLLHYTPCENFLLKGLKAQWLLISPQVNEQRLQPPSGIYKICPKDLVGTYSQVFVVQDNTEWNNLFPNYSTGAAQAHQAAPI